MAESESIRRRTSDTRERRAPRVRGVLRLLVGVAWLAVVSACGGAAEADSSTGTVSRDDGTLEARLDPLLAQSMVDGRVPGFCLTAVRGTKVVYGRCIGHADLERGIPATEETSFVTGSIGKSMTALAVMQLADEGRVNLDAPITRYVPYFRVDGPKGGQITVRQLLDQSSGLPRTTGFFFERASAATDDEALERLVRGMSSVKLRDPPGTAYEYSNWNFVVAGLIVERVSGMSYAEYMEERVFGPLGMTRTTAEPTAGTDLGKRLELAQGYAPGSELPSVPRGPATPKEWVPAGFQTSNVRDLGRYLIAQLNGGRSVTGERVVSDKAMSAMHRGYLEGESESGGGRMRYGYGWMVDHREGMDVVEHGGDAGTSASYLLLIPDERVAVGAIGNAVDYGKLQLIYNVARAMTGRETQRYETLPLPPPVPTGDFRPARDLWPDYTGRYATERGPQKVFVEDGRLKMVMGEGTLQPVTVGLEARVAASFEARSRYMDHDGLAVGFEETPRGTRITVDDPDKGRADGLRIQPGISTGGS